MKIQRVKIQNWRSIKSINVEFQELMVFIGQNNHGKSNVLSSLLFFFGLQNCGDLDFCQGETECFVEVTFSKLDDHDNAQFAKYVTAENTITVRKQITKGESHEYHGYCQNPSEAWLKEANAGDYANREAVSGIPLNAFVPATGRITKDIIKEAQQKYIEANAATVVMAYELESSHFMGLKTVAQGIFGEVFFVPAVKNASDEFNMKGKSVFNQLLSNVINDMSTTNPEYIEAKQKVRELTQILNKTIDGATPNEKRPEQISKLEQLLESEMASWNTTIDIEITPPDVDDVLRVGTNVWLNDGVNTDVSRKGNGLQRSLIFALIKSWAKVLQEERAKTAIPTAPGETATARKASKSTYFIFEEPELYLHPQAQRELYHSLKQLSETDNQVMITTHSSSFIDLEMHKSICILYKKDTTEGTKHLQSTIDLFSSLEEKKKFNMTYWINPDRGELFFAKKVILVEGPSDKSVLPLLAKKLGCYRYDFTLIDCGGKDNIPTYTHLLNSFQLPHVVVYDKDHQAHKGTDARASADISSQAIEAKLDTRFGTSQVLINDIEEEIGIQDTNQKNKPYIAIEHVSKPGYTISAGLEAKVRAIYS